MERKKEADKGSLSLVPDEPSLKEGAAGRDGHSPQRNYGMDNFEDLFATGRLYC
jgi:hypothetical protein